ncbi:hypothetical protein A3Q56_03540 [Intoshia linei]|uniref:RRM domain-containing protein n=1 Tax=Intoshia linei TaxID=1819745 RepID=A0A177B552_9BILA|nr:hypothetical protein A3Q56_03540 [Intoshia linei]
MENNQFNRISNELENVYENVNGIMQLRGNSNGSNNFDIRDDYHTIRLYGIHYTVTKGDIVRFLSDTKIHNGENGVYLITDVGGRPLGKGYVQYADIMDYVSALMKDRKFMGTYYIEGMSLYIQFRKKVMPQDDLAEMLMEPVLKIRGLRFTLFWRPTTPFSLHMRGLPFSANNSQVKKFFAPIPLANIHIGRRSDGLASGMGDVDFNYMEELEEAMLKHKNTMGHR